MTCAPRASRGSSSATKASIPGFCSPVDQTAPEADSAIRGVERPAIRLERDAPADHRADLAEVDQPTELAPGTRAPRGHHDGRGQHEPGPQIDGERALHPGHERTTGSPSGGVGSIVGASESHRSHSTRAGLNTGPSTHDRRWS